MEKAFQAVHGPVSLTIVEDGEAVQHYLLRKGRFAHSLDAPFPSLVMLDLKMPRRTGFEVLDWMQPTDSFRRIPVMIVSGSYLQEDIDSAFDLGANWYLVKPVSVKRMKHVFQVTADFWNTVSEWPSRPI